MTTLRAPTTLSSVNLCSLAASISIGTLRAASLDWGLVFAFTVASLIGFILWKAGRICPQCRKYDAFKATGGSTTEGPRLASSTLDEYRCGQCGHTQWRKRGTGSCCGG